MVERGEERGTAVDPCPACRSGRVDCAYCGGLGDLVCEACRGTGAVECPTCEGHGTVRDGEDCPDCRWGRIDCAACGGPGRVACGNRRCRHGTVTCPECGGLLPGDPVPPRPAMVGRATRLRLAAAALRDAPRGASPAVAETTPARARGTARWFWIGPAALLGLAALAFAERSSAPPDPRPALATSQARAAASTVAPASAPRPTPSGGTAPIWEPPPTATPAPVAAGAWVEVFNTGGEGLFIRFTPRASDTVTAWPDGTKLQVVGADVEADGRRWKNVRDPDGLVGWVPAEYVRATTPP